VAIKKELDKPFAHEADLQKMLARQQELNDILYKTDEQTDELTEDDLHEEKNVNEDAGITPNSAVYSGYVDNAEHIAEQKEDYGTSRFGFKRA
jgi:hypothetical protein